VRIESDPTYLDRAFGGTKLIPDDPKAAAEVEQWMSIVHTVIDPLMVRTYLLNYVFPKGADGKPDRKAIDGAVPGLEKQMGVLDATIAKNGHLTSAGFTLADINLMPILFYVQKFPEGEAAFKAAKNVAAYYGRLSARPSFQNTMPPPPQG
jgi:glutathione S-transferase